MRSLLRRLFRRVEPKPVPIVPHRIPRPFDQPAAQGFVIQRQYHVYRTGSDPRR